MNAAAKVISMDDHRQSGPQLENGYIRIANELFDAILSFKFTYRQIKVLLAVLRKTYGYGKKSDDISASQIGKMCGMPRPHVASTLVELEQMGVLNRERGKFGTVTSINKNYKEWLSLKKREMGKVNKGFGGAVLRKPEDKLNHYVYRLDHDESGTFYIGVRSCDCLPTQDRYKGSGNWTATVRVSEIRKTILSTHGSRAEAEDEEKRVIREMSCVKGMMNRCKYVKGTEDELAQNLNAASTESVHDIVQNLNSSIVQNLNTQKTTFQKTTSKDKEHIARSGDRATQSAQQLAFAQFWDAFAYKNGRKRAEAAFAKQWKLHSAEPGWLDALLNAAKTEAARRDAMKAAGRTPMYAEGWLSQERYTDEDLQHWGAFTAEQQAFIDCYNANIGDAAPQCTEWTERRAALIDIALRGKWKAEGWAEFWQWVAQNCEFKWPVSIDWFLQRDNFVAVREGKYERGAQ